MHSATYAMPDARVTVVCEAPGYAEWLDEVLIPSFTRVAFDPDAVTVIVGDKPDESGSSLPHAFPLGTRPCFVFEHEVISHDAWRVGDHIEVVDGKYEVRYIVGPTHVRVEVGNRGTGARAAVLRVIRELALAQSLANGERVMLHTSGLEREGKVVLFTGPKEAGKTTLVTRLASATGAGLLANDCALLSPSEPRSRNWDVHAVPFPVSVRADTVRRFPELFRDVPAIKRPSRLTLAEADVARTEHGTVTEPARLRLSTPQFARALRVPLSAGGQLASLAFVTVDPDITGFRLVPLPPSDAPKFVHAAVYEPRGANDDHTVFEQFVGMRRLPTADARVAAQVAGDANCVALRVGPAVLDDESVARDLLGRVDERNLKAPVTNPVAEADVKEALRTLGLTPRSMTDLGGWRSGRATFRITLDGGRVLKARRHQGRVRGARAAAVTSALGDAGFPTPVAVVDRVTIEEWVAGTPLSDLRLTRELVDEAADLLGRLHAVTSLAHRSGLPASPARRLRSRRSTAPSLIKFDRQLDDLTTAGVVGATERRRLTRVVRHGLPPLATRGLAHGDFCATNLVSVRGRALVCIDNEAVGPGFLDEDLARTWCRWPMPAWAWTRFRARYGTWGHLPASGPADLAWRAVSATRNAHRWQRARATPHDLPLGTLRRVLDESLSA